jgi:hypothetical protein
VLSFASLTAENEGQITTNRARQDAIDDDLLLEETMKAMAVGMDADNDAIRRNPGNPPTEGDDIADARTEMKLDYAPGRRDLTSPTGVLLCGVSQRIHFIQREHFEPTSAFSLLSLIRTSCLPSAILD